MLKATRAPTVRSLLLTAYAPKSRSSAVVSLLSIGVPAGRPHPEAGPRTRCARMRQGALPIAPAFAARRRISPSACRHKKLLARRAAIEFLLHFFRATVDARESQSRDRAGSRQAAARVFLHQIFALVTPIFFQVVVDTGLTHKGYSTLYVLVAGRADRALRCGIAVFAPGRSRTRGCSQARARARPFGPQPASQNMQGQT
jgi:hypothetical protein